MQREVELKIFFGQNAPGAVASAEFNLVLIQTVLIKSTTREIEAEIGHDSSLPGALRRKPSLLAWRRNSQIVHIGYV
jgi:hypothetical protein